MNNFAELTTSIVFCVRSSGMFEDQVILSQLKYGNNCNSGVNNGMFGGFENKILLNPVIPVMDNTFDRRDILRALSWSYPGCYPEFSM